MHAIPHAAIKRGLLTVEKQGKKNVFSGRILEIEGLGHLKCEQAFELSDASAERSAAGCTIKLDRWATPRAASAAPTRVSACCSLSLCHLLSGREPIMEYLTSNVVMLKWMIAEGYGDRRTLERRVARMEAWLEAPDLLEADAKAEYFETIDVNMDELTEPILCAPNDPDDARSLSTVQNEKIDEVFIGSCMTNIGHFRAAGKMVGCHVLPTEHAFCHSHTPAAAAAPPLPQQPQQPQPPRHHPPPPPTPPSPSPPSRRASRATSDYIWLTCSIATRQLDAYDGGQLPTRLWVAPPTKMDAAQLTAEGYYAIFGKVR